MNPDFSNFQGEQKLLQEIKDKNTGFDKEKETTYSSSYREFRKIEGSKYRDSIVYSPLRLGNCF